MVELGAADASAPPQFVAVGQVSLDINVSASGEISAPTPGGAVAYAARTATGLGLNAGIITAAGDDYPFSEVTPCVQRRVLDDGPTTTFRNVYSANGRQQTLLMHGGHITEADVPAAWRRPDLLLIGPLSDELPMGCADWFSAGLVCAVPQGWQRRWDSRGAVSVVTEPPKPSARPWDVCVVSEAEAPLAVESHWLDVASVLVVTRGSMGARIRCDGQWHDIPAFPAMEVDPTGAGDVWAAAFLVRYAETMDPVAAGLFASCAAAISVEAVGLAGVPSRQQIEQRLAGGAGHLRAGG
ncbi:MAG: PfkB family carbohydrate kinase [Dehalococcoidia bacterium]